MLHITLFKFGNFPFVNCWIVIPWLIFPILFMIFFFGFFLLIIIFINNVLIFTFFHDFSLYLAKLKLYLERESSIIFPWNKFLILTTIYEFINKIYIFKKIKYKIKEMQYSLLFNNIL